jgi:hypothetical protein
VEGESSNATLEAAAWISSWVEKEKLNCAPRGSRGPSGLRDKERGTVVFQAGNGEGATKVNLEIRFSEKRIRQTVFYGEFDSGSERTLAACLRHASRTGQIE